MVLGCPPSFASSAILYLMSPLAAAPTISGFVVWWGGESTAKEQGRDGAGNYPTCARGDWGYERTSSSSCRSPCAQGDPSLMEEEQALSYSSSQSEAGNKPPAQD